MQKATGCAYTHASPSPYLVALGRKAFGETGEPSGSPASTGKLHDIPASETSRLLTNCAVCLLSKSMVLNDQC